MRRVNSSHASLAISITALFVALGGTALAVTQIGTNQIKNSAVTTKKLHNGAVTNAKLASKSVSSTKLANSAVTSAQLAGNSVSSANIANSAVTNAKLANDSISTSDIQTGAVTATQVAPNTFLPATGTAADAARLGGLLPGDFINGIGFTENRRLVVPAGQSIDLFGAGFGEFSAGCSGTDTMSVTWTPTVSNIEYLADVQLNGASPELFTLNGTPAGTGESEPSPATGLPFLITYQIGYTSAGQDHIATTVINGRFESGTGCVFVGQELSTG
jgi:hypothetical protein